MPDAARPIYIGKRNSLARPQRRDAGGALARLPRLPARALCARRVLLRETAAVQPLVRNQRQTANVN